MCDIDTFSEVAKDGKGVTLSDETSPVLWADAGMDATYNGDEDIREFEFVGGVGVPDTEATVITRRVQYVGRDRALTADSIELQPASGFDSVPMASAYDTAAAFALAAACFEDNRQTPDPEVVRDVAQHLRTWCRSKLAGKTKAGDAQ